MSQTGVLPLSAMFEREILSALNKAGIYDIDSYGWLNETDPDPEFIGHVMWQTAPPSIAYEAPLGKQPVERSRHEMEKFIITAGEDFTGLMQASRLSIGFALLWRQEAYRNPLSSFFWLHQIDAFVKLAIASDRLRDLLIVSSAGLLPASYKRQAQENRRYVTPFKEAGELLARRGFHDGGLTEPLASLPDLAVQLLPYIRRRNAIVHEVATRMAELRRDEISELQERLHSKQARAFSPPSDDSDAWITAAAARAREIEGEVNTTFNEVTRWYQLLIQTSNAVFQVEHWSRTLRR